MILGKVEDVEAEYERSRAMGKSTQDWPQRRDASTTTDEFLWPNATVPYEIDPGFNEQALADIRQAINDWNTKTLITLVERTTEADFVRFRPERSGCASPVGRQGGPQPIWLSGPDGCGVGTTIHEIGHSVGLWHEHQREDRDAYVMIPEATLLGSRGMWYRAVHPPDGPYDYASTMHYGGIETIPPGMPVPADRLSPGDVVGVARLYGRPPPTTTISTNPPGLEIEVDGQAVTTPATFHWSPGSEHVVEARSPQIVAGIRLVFARWTDGGAARHTVTANPEDLWFEASYVVQRSLLACADPWESGEVNILPNSPDGHYTIRSPVGIEAVTSSGSSYRFVEWSATNRLWERMDGRQGSFVPSSSSNPAIGVIATGVGAWKWRRSEYKAQFGTGPMFRIGSNVDGIRISANGDTQSLPWAFPANLYPDGVTVEIPEEPVHSGTDVRYRFGGWSDGAGGNTHTVAVPTTGGSINAKFMPEYRLLTSVRNRWGEEDVISTVPPSEDGFYDADTQVHVTAAPSPDKHFAGWTGDVAGYDPAQLVVMESAKSIEAVFTHSPPLRPGETRELLLGATSRFEIYNFARGWNVLVPPDGAELTVRFQSSSAADVDLYVRRASEVRARPSEPGRKPRIDADFESTTPGAGEEITISRESTPRLENDVYFVALVVPPTNNPIRGTLAVSIRRSGIVRAWPAALTFVTAAAVDGPPQTVQLTHATDGPVRYRVELSRPWISATPNEWVQTASRLTEVSIAAHGASLLPGTHWGKVKILRVDDPDLATGGTPTGIELPVVLAVLSSNADASRRVNRVWITSRPAKGDTFGAGESVEAWVDLVAPVNIAGKPTLALSIGNQIRDVQLDQARSSHCEGGDLSLRFRYEVQEEDRDADGISISEYAFGLNGGRLDTIDGIPSILPLAPIPSQPEHKVDGSKVAAPQVTLVRVYSRPQDGVAYGVGEQIRVRVEFGYVVRLTGRPTLALTLGTEARQLALSSSNGRNLWFWYEVQAEDSDVDGVSIHANALTLNGGSIRSLAGADARLDLGSHAFADDAEHKVDGGKVAAPRVTNLRIQSRPQDGVAYGTGEQIRVWVGFGHVVQLTGRLTLGTEERQAALSSSNGRNLWFRYEVQTGDMDADGISIPASALSLNGGTIRSVAGPDATLDMGAHAIVNDPEHKVDGGG